MAYWEVRYKRMKDARRRGTHTEWEWNILLDALDHRCVLCQKQSTRLTKDHIVPVSMGGSDLLSNLQPLCHSCNASKGTEAFNVKNIRLSIAHMKWAMTWPGWEFGNEWPNNPLIGFPCMSTD